MAIIDLTLPVYDHMPSIYPGTPQTTVKHCWTFDKEGANIQLITINTHAGTHLDVPYHVGMSTKLDEISLDRLYGTGVVLDMPRGKLGSITAQDFEKAEPTIAQGDIVLLNTGWGKLWGKKSDMYHKKNHPGITRDAAEWLANRKIKVIGIDALTIHCPCPGSNEMDPNVSVHRVLLSNNIVIVECLTNLEKVSGRRLTIGIFPLSLKGGDGGPVRAIAFV